MIKKFLTEKGYLAPEYQLVMSEKEEERFKEHIKYSKSYLEFGAGGSTLCALEKSKTQVISIESSKEWINHIESYSFAQRMINKQRLKLYYIDIGPTRKWGFPKGLEHKSKFPNYSSSIFDELSPQNLDTIFIDGRFRVACILSVIIHCNTNLNVLVLVHDFWNRPHYHVVLEYMETIEKVDTLAIFKIKKNINMDAVKSHYEKYKFNPK